MASALANTVKEARLLLLHCVKGILATSGPLQAPPPAHCPAGSWLSGNTCWMNELENYGKGIKKKRKRARRQDIKEGSRRKQVKGGLVKRWKVKMK